MLQYHAEEPPPSLGDVISGLPEEMVQLVDAMLAKEPAARPSLAAVRTVIKRLRTTQLPSASLTSADDSPSASRLGAEPVVPMHAALGGSAESMARTLPLGTTIPPGASLPTVPDSSARRPRTSSSRYRATTPGVSPPAPSAARVAAEATRPSGSHRAWLIIAALLAIAAGAALASVLVG
jgi:serine/threonine-protein kinase